MTEALGKQFQGAGEWLLVLVPLLLIAYLLPFFVAAGRKHRFSTAIGLINLLLGWTLLGWLAAIIWAVNRDVRKQGDDFEPSGPLNFRNEPRLNERSIEHRVPEYGHTKKCRFCAESIMAEALVCHHCGRDVDAAEATAQQGRPVTAASMEQHFKELQALLKDHEDATAQKFAEGELQPAMNYEPEQEKLHKATEPVSPDVVRELSGWKKVG